MTAPDTETIEGMVESSMLHQARKFAASYGGQGRFWQRPYAETRPRIASAVAPVWFTAYPASIVTRPGESVLATLGDQQLWSALSSIGVRGIHTGPTKRAGGWRNGQYTPTIDGNFDRIGFDIDRPSAPPRSSSPSRAWPPPTTRS